MKRGKIPMMLWWVAMLWFSSCASTPPAHLRNVCESHPEARMVAFYPGTFSPPHVAHVEMVHQVIRQLHPDLVVVMPDVVVWHKPDTQPFVHRRKMSELAFGGIPEVEVAPDCLVEQWKDGEVLGILNLLHERYPNAQILHVMGEDTFAWMRTDRRQVPSFPQWRALVTPRNGQIPALEGSGLKAELLPVVLPPVSSTEIRRKLAGGFIPDELPSAVYHYIRVQGLFMPIGVPSFAPISPGQAR